MKKTLSFCFFAASFFLLFRGSSFQEGALFLLSALLHEGGHLLAACFCGYPPTDFFLSPSGAVIGMDLLFAPYKKEILIYLAGPFVNGAAALLSFLGLRQRFDLLLLHFFFFNLLFCLLNLLPIKGLDGYQALVSFLCLFQKEETFLSSLNGLSLFCCALLLVAGTFLLFRTANASLLIFSLVLLWEGKTKKVTKYS